MSNFRPFLKCWVPVIVWMVVIFSASGDTRSSQHSSRIIAPLVRWLYPDISPEALDLIVLLVRKGAHLAEYAILALLLWRALRQIKKDGSQPWSWRQARLAVLIVMLYAATDELHQVYVPRREGCVQDVLLDTSGGVAGIFFLWRIGRWRRRW